MTDHSILERRLRDAADPSVWNDVSPDAWQQNQRLVAADQARRRGRRLSVIAAAAAAVVVIAGAAWALRSGEHQALPANGGNGDKVPVPQVTRDGKVHLQGGVEVARVKPGKGTVRFELAFAAGGPDGPGGLCQLMAFDGSAGPYGSNGSCGGQVDHRTDPGTHIDFLSTGATGVWLTVAGAVDSKVSKLKVWLADGDVVNLPLVDLGSDGYRGFSVFNNGGTQTPTRLVALASDGRVLEATPLSGTGTEPWRPTQRKCEESKVYRFLDGPLPDGITVAFSHDSVRVSAPSGAFTCMPLNSMAKLNIAGDVLVLVPPEAANFRLVPPSPGQRLTLVNVEGTPWRFVAVTPPAGHKLTDVKVEIADATDARIATVHWTATTTP
jgi:hypothetical protein